MTEVKPATPATVQLCDWCGKNEAEIDDVYGPVCACELADCSAMFCDAQCADFHIGRHEDYGDCVRDRVGNIVRDRTKRGRTGVVQVAR